MDVMTTGVLVAQEIQGAMVLNSMGPTVLVPGVEEAEEVKEVRRLLVVQHSVTEPRAALVVAMAQAVEAEEVEQVALALKARAQTAVTAEAA